MEIIVTESENRCVMCGCIIPEGHMVCWICERDIIEISEYN
mgnify:CR=1 FL=1